MIENEERQGGPDEVPHEDQLDVEGPNESTQPSTAPAPGSDEEQDEDQS